MHRWLLAHGRQEEGRAALEKLVASADVDKEAADISAQVDSDRAARISVWAALGTPELRAQLHIGDYLMGAMCHPHFVKIPSFCCASLHLLL